MKITVTRKETQKLKAFKKREWAVANIEHYGKNPGWSFKQFLITSFDLPNHFHNHAFILMTKFI